MTTIFDYDDVVLRLLQFLGPRHTIIGIGATNHNLHRLSTSDSLWRIFWEVRCLLLTKQQQQQDGRSDEEDTVGPHGAALVFRGAYRREIIKSIAPADDGANRSSSGHVAEHGMLYQAYITTHTMMKHSNVRVEAYGRRVAVTKCDIVGRSNLITPPCTQTWPGRLSHGGREHDDEVGIGGERGGRDGGGLQRSTLITCLNPSKAWCDDPRCDKARCGMEGCLRYYRFSPADYYLRVIDPKTTFVRCSWCNVSFCNVHGGGNTNENTDGYYYNRRPSEDDQKSNSGRSWYQCDECNLSSCPDCISQVLFTPTDCTEEGSCRVVTAGNPCNRKLCSNCVWHVGRKRQSITTGNVPGGEYHRSSDIVTVRGVESLHSIVERPIEWEDFEKCCSKCLRHVEFRWKELTAMQDSFHGFMP